ncbi:MAG: GntR family transcriptional regulator [Bifidobacteriaceae bacterium]|jgi:DNA-binding GntR family transcriptional regulator|nr:GntR family transcriptional regulator [Bifidobacteriaceae bacterium]
MTAQVKRQVLGDGVFDAITEMLFSQAFASGDRIRVDALARELGVSPTPVREALARIEGTGLVIREPMRGYLVAPRMSPDEIAALMDARILIEPHNAQAACALGEAGLLEGLVEALERMSQAPLGPGLAEYRPFLMADADFHAVIGRHCGNSFLAGAVESFSSHLRRFSLFGERRVPDAEKAIEEHRAVLQAFQERDPAAAARGMAAHLEGVRSRALAECAESDPARPDNSRAGLA